MEVFKVEICVFNVEMLKEICLIDTGPHNDNNVIYDMWISVFDVVVFDRQDHTGPGCLDGVSGGIMGTRDPLAIALKYFWSYE